MNILQALAYFLREAIGNLLRGWRISSLAVATTALSLLIGGTLMLVGSNVTRALEAWRSDAQLVVYLRPDISQSEVAALAEELRKVPFVESVAEVASEQALERFGDRFPDLQEVLLELERSPFPVSLEIKARGEEATLDRWLSSLASRPEVSDIEDDAEWLKSMNAAARVASGMGLLVGGLLMVAAAVSIASVVRLSTLVYRKEIAAMRLIGATEFFVRGPFVVEGLLQGLTGSFLALAALWVGFQGLERLEVAWFVRDLLLGSFLSVPQAFVLVALGGLAGLAGGIMPLRERSGVFG